MPACLVLLAVGASPPLPEPNTESQGKRHRLSHSLSLLAGLIPLRWQRSLRILAGPRQVLVWTWGLRVLLQSWPPKCQDDEGRREGIRVFLDICTEPEDSASLLTAGKDGIS